MAIQERRRCSGKKGSNLLRGKKNFRVVGEGEKGRMFAGLWKDRKKRGSSDDPSDWPGEGRNRFAMSLCKKREILYEKSFAFCGRDGVGSVKEGNSLLGLFVGGK